jgi:hypothetical protein
VRDGDDARRVHNTTGLYFLSRTGTGVAHDALDCMFVPDIDTLIDRPAWRVATAAQARALGYNWCEVCCAAD